jgi:hypothetical protein
MRLGAFIYLRLVRQRVDLFAVSQVIDLCRQFCFSAIGADSTGATGTFAPVLAIVLGRGYNFAPVLF